MQSKAATVEEYLRQLPPDRREALSVVRNVILKNLGKGYQEGMQYGMIGYSVPHSIFPDGYHCDPRQPLPFAGLASQKQYMSVYLISGYADPVVSRKFQIAWAKTGKKLDMGKCCIRFKKVEDLALDVIAQTIREFPVKRYIELYTTSIRTMNKQAAKRAAARDQASTSAVKSSKKTTPQSRTKAQTKARGSTSRPAPRSR
ncbi:MAG: DUF1801 domain-containing protein [Phycisphaerae bacterium]|nr:DUF1801 domain-containing protein [Phycisphaerae bacterium]